MKNKYFESLSSILLLIVTVTIMLFISEGLLRVKNCSMKNYDIEMWKYAKTLKKKSNNRILGHEHVRSRCATLQSVEICINNIGLRGEDFSFEKDVGRKVLFLGSSITLGWGVSEEKLLTSLIQKKCRTNSIKAKILNAGIGNYNTVRYVERFFTILKDIEPTDIVLQYFINDAETLNPGRGNFFLQNYQLAVTLYILYNRLFFSSGEDTLIQHYKKVYNENASGFIAMRKSLKRLSNYAIRNNINVFFVMTPDIHNLNKYPFLLIHQTMKQIAYEYGFKYLDLLPYFADIGTKQLWAMPGDPHPNAFGHQIMADAIYPFIFETK